jgi:RHS repeat-associated protein
MLGTTLGSKTKGTKYSAAALTAFGERMDNADGPSPAIRSLGEGWFTGKPHVEGLGHAFLFRNYRAGLAKWQTADPLGYPDGWNQLAYCGNGVISNFDIAGAFMIGYFDLNGGEVPTLVMSANELVVGHTLMGGSQAQDTEGEFFCGIASISRVNGMVLIKIGIAINVVASRHDAEFQPGEKSKFHEHSSEPNDSFMLNPVYEAVVAHERGHATAFFAQWKSLFVSYLNQSNIDDSSIDISILESRVTTAYLAAWAAHTAYSGYLANQYTMDWFDSNPTWERLRNETNSNGDELYVWRKKE